MQGETGIKIQYSSGLNLPSLVKQLGEEYCISANYRVHSRRSLFATTIIRCAVCGETEGKIYCHHKDGNPRNMSLENLEWRCPHCHRQTHSTDFNKNVITKKRKFCAYLPSNMEQSNGLADH